MTKQQYPVTTAIRALRAAHVQFEVHLYAYEDRGGTAASAAALGVDEHLVIKTLILQDDQKRPLIALMHGDSEVSTKNLARHLGVKTVAPCTPQIADKHSGYQVGGTSPFGTKRPMPVYVQATIAQLPHIYINGGKRGFLVKMDPAEAIALLKAELVEMSA